MSTVNAVTGATTATPSSQTTDPLLDKDAFLKLLTAQLKYQDPMSPTDSSTFTSQMSQLSETEQMTNVATDQKKLVASADKNTALGLIGRTVTYLGTDGSPATGLVSNVDVSADAPSLTVDGIAGIDLATLMTVQ